MTFKVRKKQPLFSILLNPRYRVGKSWDKGYNNFVSGENLSMTPIGDSFT
jgi:hypothetical protein